MKLADILTRQHTKTVTMYRMETPFCNPQAPAYEKWTGSIIKAIKFSDDYNLTSIVWEKPPIGQENEQNEMVRLSGMIIHSEWKELLDDVQ